MAQAFLANWVHPYGIPLYLLTDNGIQCVSKFFEAVCGMLGIKQVITTAYHPHTSGLTERLNKTLVQEIRFYVAERQTEWHEYVQPLNYEYNVQVHRTTGTTTFDLVLTRQPPALQAKTSPTALPDHAPETASTEQVKWYILALLRDSLASAGVRTTLAQR